MAKPRNNAPKSDLIRAVFQSGAELRADDTVDGEADPPKTLFGHLAVFNKWTEIRSSWEGNFMEMMAPGAFTKTISENRQNIKVLYDHGMDPQLGNKPLGPIKELREDGTGVYYEVELIDTNYNDDFIIPAASAGLLGASFRFQVVRDEWDDQPKKSGDNPNGIPERTIREVKMAEFGPVTFPAYTAATAGVRGRQEFNLWRDLDDDARSEFAEFLVRARFKNDHTETRDVEDAAVEEVVLDATEDLSSTVDSESDVVEETQDTSTSEDEVETDTEPDGAEDAETTDDDAADGTTDDAPAEEPPAERQKTTTSERRRRLLELKGITK